MSDNTDRSKLLKVRDLRDKYDRDEVVLGGWMTPRSENQDIHTPTRVKDHYRNDYLSGLSQEQVVWEEDLDEKLEFLTGNRGSTRLMVKNVKVRVEEVE